MDRLRESYEEFPRIEEAFRAALDESLRPRGPDLLYELVQGFELPADSLVLDVGCGEGPHAYRLAERFGFTVVGIDPHPPHVEATPQVRFVLGAAEALPVEDNAADLVWCRDVLVHVADLEKAYAEFRRARQSGCGARWGSRRAAPIPPAPRPRSRRRDCGSTSGSI
jgi:SAM-dependent methyltransferase